jgi:hypothetical protein
LVKTSWIFATALSLIILAFTARAATNQAAQSAKIQANKTEKVYKLASQLLDSMTTSTSVENLLRLDGMVSQHADTEKWLATHKLSNPGKASVTAGGLQMDNGGHVETLKMVEGRPGYFIVRGIEIDLSKSRPLAERFHRLQEILSSRTSSLQKLFMSNAEAADPTAPVDGTTTDVLAASIAINDAKAAFDLEAISKKVEESQNSCHVIGDQQRSSSPVQAHQELTPAAAETAKTIDDLRSRYCGSTNYQMYQNLGSIFSRVAHPLPTTISDACTHLNGLKTCMDAIKLSANVTPEKWKEISGPLADFSAGPAGSGSSRRPASQNLVQ